MVKTARRYSKVTREVFCKTWNSSASVDEVAQKLGMNRASAVSKASVLRKMGVDLKHFKQGRPKTTDVKTLNEILHESPTDRKSLMNDILRCLREIVES